MPTAAAQIPKPPQRAPEGFPGKTPVITDERIMHMQDVGTSHRILDRNGSWQPVTDVHQRKGSTVRVSGHGHPGIEASDGHPVLVRSTANGGTPGWMSAGLFNRKRHAWATPTHIDPLPIPGGAPETPEEWHLVGSYLRSGQVDGDRITIKAADQREAQHIRAHVAAGSLGAGREDKGGAVTFEGRDREQARWLAEHFGDKAHTKTVPPWALGMDETHRRALLKGYYGPEWKPLPTTSPFLVTGMRLVAETLGERTDIEHVFAPLRPTYQARRLEDGHGHSGHHSWLGNQQARKAVRKQKLWDLEVGKGGGGSFVAGIGGKVVSAAGEKPKPKPNAQSRAAAKPPANALRNGAGGGGSNGRSTQSPDSKQRRMPRTIPSVASIADALGSSVPVIGGRKPRSAQRDMVPLTAAQEERVQQGVRSLDGVRREEAVANSAAVPQSARAQEAARRAEDRLNQRGMSVAELAELRQVDALNKDIPGTAASSIAQQRGLVQQDVHDVLAAERPAHEQRVIRDWDDAQTINHLGKVTAEQFLPGHLAHPNGHPQPDTETALINDPLVRLNNAGLVTIGSQPGMANSVGYSGDIFHQNAAVQGFADAATTDRIRTAAEAEGLTVIQNSRAGRRTDMSTADRESGFGAHLSRSDIDGEFGGRMNDTLRNAEQVTVIDQDVGRNDRLERFAERMDEQRRSDPINDAWMVDDLNGLKPGTTAADIRQRQGEAVPDLRDELRTPAEREEREARMAAAEQVHAQDREQAQPRDTADRTQPLPLERPGLAAEGGGPMFDRFATEGVSAETAPRHVGAQVDGRTVPAEIIAAPTAHGQPERAPATVDSYGFAPGLSAPPDRARLEPGSQEPDLITQIADARAMREMQAVPVGLEQNGRVHSAAPPLAMPIGTPRTAEPTTRPTPPEEWDAIYPQLVQSAAAAREAGFPVDRQTFERHLDDAWQQLQREQSGTGEPWRERGLPQAGEGELRTLPPVPIADHNGVAPEHVRGLARAGERDYPELPPLATRDESAVAPELQRGLAQAGERDLPIIPTREAASDDATPPELQRGLRQAGEGELPEPVYGQDRTAEQDDVAPEHRRGLAQPGENDLPEPAPIGAQREADSAVEPEHQRGLRRPEDAELPPSPVRDDVLPTDRPEHDHEVLGRHGLDDLARPDAEETNRAPQAEDREPTAEPEEPAEERTPERQEPDTTPDAKPETEPEAKPEPEKAAEPEKPEPDKTPEPEAKEPTPEPEPEPEREPRQWEQDAKEAMEPAHSEPAPAHEAPSHHMGPEL